MIWEYRFRICFSFWYFSFCFLFCIAFWLEWKRLISHGDPFEIVAIFIYCIKMLVTQLCKDTHVHVSTTYWKFHAINNTSPKITAKWRSRCWYEASNHSFINLWLVFIDYCIFPTYIDENKHQLHELNMIWLHACDFVYFDVGRGFVFFRFDKVQWTKYFQWMHNVWKHYLLGPFSFMLYKNYYEICARTKNIFIVNILNSIFENPFKHRADWQNRSLLWSVCIICIQTLKNVCVYESMSPWNQNPTC